MSSMLFKFDKDNYLWNTYSIPYNKDIFLIKAEHLKDLYKKRIEIGDVLDLNEILREFGIVPEECHYGWFVLCNRYSKEKPDFIKLIVCNDDMIIFEVTDLRRD